ncbi:MAG: winged helix-turn-helix domain-containing protein [Pseudomonadota bacterium]|nr:winged helix-turn-helix domain-containing protein [Pseudomonadota bacterium]
MHTAVTEALKLAQLGEPAFGEELAAALNSVEPILVIVDESAADKRILKTLQPRITDDPRKYVFILGDGDGAGKDYAWIESFSKPVRLGHLLTRLSFHLRERSHLRNDAIGFGPYRFEPHKREIARQDNGAIIRLTEKETALLDYLAQSAAPVAREELLAAVWGHGRHIDTHTLETHIYQLRRKLDPDGKGVNYLLNQAGSYALVNPGDKDGQR